MLTADTGCGYVCALLIILFAQMGMTQFRAERCGQDFGVSYVLLCENTKYSFRGYPDFVVHKDDIGAGRILVATGEIQSTRHADIQNSIYGVGCLLKNITNRPILCLSIFKNKTAQLSVARLREDETVKGHQKFVGAVTLRYVVSPSPMDLKTTKGIKDLATRIYNMCLEIQTDYVTQIMITTLSLFPLQLQCPCPLPITQYGSTVYIGIAMVYPH